MMIRRSYTTQEGDLPVTTDYKATSYVIKVYFKGLRRLKSFPILAGLM